MAKKTQLNGQNVCKLSHDALTLPVCCGRRVSATVWHVLYHRKLSCRVNAIIHYPQNNNVQTCLQNCKYRELASTQDLCTVTATVLINCNCATVEAAGRLQAGHSRLQVAARSSSIVPGRRLPADRGLRTTPASLRSRQRPHCFDLATGVFRSRVREFRTVYTRLTAAA